MNLIKCSISDLEYRIKTKAMRIIMFGSGTIGQISAPQILKECGLLQFVDCYIDNDEKKWETEVTVCGERYKIRSPKYLDSCPSQTIIILNISRYSEAIAQLSCFPFECYIFPMMLIEEYCSTLSSGEPIMADEPLIPKKIHYMWLGENTIPLNLQKCIDSWKRFCPDYEIIQWNEHNYDLDKQLYMRQAYDTKAYGFVPDYARLDILYHEGGLYLDTDVEITRNIDDMLYQEAFCGVEKWQVLNFGGMSGAMRKHPMIKKFLDARKKILFINENGEQNRNTCGFYDTTVAINEGYKLNGKTQFISGMNIYAYDYFHPYDYMSGICNTTRNTHSVHWFNGGWMDENMKLANENARKEYKVLLSKSLSI